MTHDIIDNQSQKLIDTVKSILPQTDSARIAVGYFFLSGLQAIAPALFNVNEIRLLIGSATDPETIEQISEGARRLREAQAGVDRMVHPKAKDADKYLTHTREELALDASFLDQSDANQQVVSSLVDLVAEGKIKVKVYTRGRLHAKAYIFNYGPIFDQQGRQLPNATKGIAVVGSSNLTLAGLTHNSELNVLIHGDANHEELTQWFDRLWDESPDFNEQLMTELRRSWAVAKLSPYEVYLKALYEFVKDRLEEESQGEFLWQSEITAALADFQRNAVRRAIQVIRQYNGAFISDVVGLGKSYIGAAILKHFERHDRARGLIICPQSLVKMWQHYKTAYDLNCEVLSSGMIKDDPDRLGYNILIDEETYQDRDFILIDESHNFRNPDTQKYKLLQTYLQAGDRRCVLLTATPRNKNFRDVYHQVKLFHVGERTQIPIDPPNLIEFVKKVEAKERKAASLLSNIMVRRTRMDVLRWYGFDSETDERVDPFNFEPYHRGEKKVYIKVGDKKQYFPKRKLQTIEYNIEDTYSGLYDQLLTHIGKPGEHPKGGPDELKYARYGLWNYVKKEKQNIAPYSELQRAGINLRGLVRISLFKRFESSVYAFQETIGRMVHSHNAFLKAMDKGFIPAGKEASKLLLDATSYDPDELLEKLEDLSGKYDLNDFHSEDLQKDIMHDLEILKKMQKYVEPICPAEDDKLQMLRSWLKDSQNGFEPLAKKKCLIFTQYKDTAKYLFDHTKDIFPEGFDVIYGHEKDKSMTAWRFAPKANPQFNPRIKTSEIKVLIATDVMSEGLNLQDCDQIINYDLHWNPVVLIQRFGRIDRIGTEFETIYGFNFLPEKSLEVGLGLKEKLEKRIFEIQNMLGGDAAILDPTEQFIDQAFIAIYQGEQLEQYEPADDEEEMVDLTEAEEFLRQMKLENPALFEKIASMRDGVRSAKKPENEKAYVVCRGGEFRQIYSINASGMVEIEDIPTALGKMKCDPDEPAVELPAEYNKRISTVQDTFEKNLNQWRALKRVAPAQTLAQKYINRELTKLLNSLFTTPDQKAQVELMMSVFSKPLTKAVHDELKGLRRNRVTDLALLDSLDKVYRRFKLDEYAGKIEEEDTSVVVPLVVCSMAS
jgi:superfamily II DNA/RNA helicase